MSFLSKGKGIIQMFSYAKETKHITTKVSETVIYKFSSVAYRNVWVAGDKMNNPNITRNFVHWPSEKEKVEATFVC